MSKKILAILLCLSVLFSLVIVPVSANSDFDNDISFDRLGVENDLVLESIAVTTTPTKVDYVEGEALDVTGGKVTLTYVGGTTDDVDLTVGMVTGFDGAAAGKQTLTVTYEGKTAFFEVIVNHEYVDADCDTPKTCKHCGDTDGKAKGHSYAAATCTKPATCTVCKAATGKAKGHSYAAATCTKPATCTVCKATTGKAKGHSYAAATCTKPATCKVCKATTGKAKGHTYVTTTTKATLSKNGSIVKKCACGVVNSKTTIKYVKSIKLSATSYTYDGKTKSPSVTVKDSGGKTLKKNTDYTVTYAKGRKNVGTYKVTVKMKGKYSGSKTLTFKINPAKTTVKKLTAAKKSLKVSITKKTTQVTGYEVQYSTSKKFTSAKTKVIKSAKTTSSTIKSLKAKKTYYVRVRTYKTVSGKKYYSAWSSAKSKKTK